MSSGKHRLHRLGRRAQEGWRPACSRFGGGSGIQGPGSFHLFPSAGLDTLAFPTVTGRPPRCQDSGGRRPPLRVSF